MALVLYTELKYKRIECLGLSFLTYTDCINEENYPRVLPYPVPEEEEDTAKPKDEDDEPEVKFELDVDYLVNLDPKLWKDQDHYKVLGLQNARYYASEDDLRRAYRKIVLRHHPDKRKGQGAIINNPEEDYFTCITRAYETLGNPVKRRSYDSIDPEFNDDLPSVSEIEADFIGVLGPCFKVNARWSEKKNVPKLGTLESERAHVEKFYDFWYDFQSWREFSYLDEEDKDKGQDRDERRWIEKQNKVTRAKRKKEESARIRQMVDLAYNNDPRIVKFKKEEKDKKLAAKRAKQDAAQAQKAEEDRMIKEAAQAKLKAEQAEQKRIEQLQKEKEIQKRALKKERKVLRDAAKANDYFSVSDDHTNKIKNMENVEKICELFKLMELQELNKRMLDSSTVHIEFGEAVNRIEEMQDVERKKTAQPNSLMSTIGKSVVVAPVNKKGLWTDENVQLLIKAVNLFPAGTSQRWDVVAKFINQHATNLTEATSFNSKDVLNKAKDIKTSDFSKNEMKANVNQKAFESFEKNKKELRVLDNSEISTKDVADIKKKGQMVNGDSKPKMNGHAEPEEPKESKEPEVKTNGSSTSPPASWSKEEQALLEQAIKTYPISTPDRWDMIASCVPNRSKKDCLRRVKELVDLVNAKKTALNVK